MNQQQLETARLERWSHNGHARQTQEDAQAWLETIGFCPLAPLVLPGNPPAPTLLEAFLGKPLPQPTLDDRDSMHSLLSRLVRAKIAVPLLLISPAGEQPDFVATLEALPFLYAMRGDRDWRGQPAATGQGRVSQLALHCWQELDRNGAKTLDQLQRALGGELTQAAVLRALCELWGHLRVYPQLQVDDAGQIAPPVWELLARTYGKQVSIGAGLSQSAALSGILSIYLSAVLAASDAEIVAFFSPLASQSKTREMVHGLTATRQLGRVPYEGGMLLHLKDGLPPALLIDLHVPDAPERESGFSGRPERSFGAGAGRGSDRTPARNFDRNSERGPIRKWEPRPRPASDFAARPARLQNPISAEGASTFERPPRRDFAEKKFSGSKFGAKKFDGPKPEWKRREGSSNSERPARFNNPAGARPMSADRPVRSARPQDSDRPRPASSRPAFGTKSVGASERPFKKPFAKSFDKPRSFDKAKSFDKPKSFGSTKSLDKPRTFDKPYAKPFVKRDSSGDGAERPFKKPFVKKNWEARPAPRRDGDSPVRSRDGARPAPRPEWKKPRTDDTRPRDARPSEGRDFRPAKPAFKKASTDKPAFTKAGAAGKSGATKFGAGKPAARKFSSDKKTDKPFHKKTSSDQPFPKKASPKKHAARKHDTEKRDASSSAGGPARKDPFWMKPMYPKRKKKKDD